LIKKYDWNRDENSIADIDFSDLENFKLKINDTEIKPPFWSETTISSSCMNIYETSHLWLWSSNSNTPKLVF